MKTADDRALFYAYVRKGDVDALEKVVNENAAWLTAFLRTMLPACDIDDVFQDVWFRIIKAAPDYAGGAIKPFIITIARRAIADRFRKIGKIRSFEENDNEDALAEVPSQDPAPSDSVEVSITSDQVRNYVSRLPLSQREVILLRIEGDLTCEEIAKELSIPLSTVLTRIRRTTQMLKKIFGENL